ncbi:MAG: regulatory protein RecX [Candidatus Omnitrophica bacterium]|nr:regulatory protein RecX [Candidatus Omnitrophota bacterium]
MKRDLDKAKKYCLRLLAIRARSEREVMDRLEKAGYDAGMIAGLMQLLKKDGLLDDAKFAGGWIESRLRSNPKGKRVLARELELKGIPRDVIDCALEEKASELGDKNLASRLLKKKIGTGTRSLDMKEKARLFRFLVSRGIAAEAAEEAIEEN